MPSIDSIVQQTFEEIERSTVDGSEIPNNHQGCIFHPVMMG